MTPGLKDQTELRVVIAEDTVLLREGLRRVLTDVGLDVAGTAGDAEQLLSLVAAARPDVVLTDIRMPPTQTTEGLQAALEIRRRWPGTAVIVLSQHVETEHLFELLAGDPRGIGYVLKERIADIAQFTDAIRRLAAGESVIDPQVVSRLVARPSAGQSAGNPHRTRAGPDGRGTVQPRDREPAVHVAQDRGDPCRQPVRQARPATRSGRPPPGPSSPNLSTPVSAGHHQRERPPRTAMPDLLLQLRPAEPGKPTAVKSSGRSQLAR
jgi:DNA-binding NarL/FixJ family response regulator